MIRVLFICHARTISCIASRNDLWCSGATSGNDRNFDYGFTTNDVGVVGECSECEVQ